MIWFLSKLSGIDNSHQTIQQTNEAMQDALFREWYSCLDIGVPVIFGC